MLSHGIKVNTEKHFDSLITEPEKMTRVKTKMEKPHKTKEDRRHTKPQKTEEPRQMELAHCNTDVATDNFL